MDAVFPIGFPSATAFYLVLYVLTLAIHVIFMNYVLAGAGYLAAVSIFTGGETVRRHKTPMAMILRDWMPFAISAAITAGVAPLLFIQILYKTSFYTANLLLFHRWMAIVPVLILGFYLAYLLKSKTLGQWPAILRTLVGVGMFLCIAFVGYSWTENHLLAIEDRQAWVDFYRSSARVYHNPQLLPRFLLWAFGAIPTMALIVGWQLWHRSRREDEGNPAEPRRVALPALAGIVLCAASGVLYYSVLSPDAFDAVMGRLARPYLIAACLGLVLQTVGWSVISRRRRFAATWLAIVTTGVLFTILGMTVVREAIRLSTVNIAALYEQHQSAANVGGLPVFLAFLAVNAALISWCVILVRRNGRRSRT